TDLAADHGQLGRTQHLQVVSGVVCEPDQIRTVAVTQAGKVENLPGSPACGTHGVMGAEPGAVQPDHLVDECAHRKIGACEHRDSPIAGTDHHVWMILESLSEPCAE